MFNLLPVEVVEQPQPLVGNQTNCKNEPNRKGLEEPV